MESDLSLIEISGEDDSLLQQTPSLHDPTAAAAANYCFSCSPLQIPGSTLNSHRSSRFSPIMGLKDNAGIEEPSCSTPIGSSNKENISVKKSEVPKLSVESQQMKRRKRPGAYNLRKSLAWDRAFFTEEGVLNSLELSMLSGSIGNSNRKVLPTIHEEGRTLSVNSGSNSDSAVLQVLEENLFKETHATNSNERDNGGSLLMKHVSSARDNAASTSAGMPKMLSNQRGNRTRSKSGGCPRPVVFPSLKRPANASTTKSAMKESKIPKIPASRSGAHSLPKSNKNNVLSTSHSKHNQIGQTDIVQKSARIQDPFKNTKSSANKAKAGSDSSSLSAKSPLQHPRRNMPNSTLEVGSSTNPQPPLVTKANCGLEVFPAAVLPPTGSRAPDAHDLYRKTGVVPQNTQYIGGNMRDTQFQTIKPSGLRMPSPSLGFFCQPKSSASNSSSQKATQSSNIPKSYIPGLQRLKVSNYTHDPRLLHAPEKMPKMDNNATVSGNSRVSGSSTECSLPSAYSDASHENVELKLEGSNALRMETMLPCYPKSSELMKDNQQEHKIVGGDKGLQECGEPHKDDQSSSKEDSDFEMNGDDWLLQSRSSDQLKKDSNNEVAISCSEFIYSKMDELENFNFASQHSCAVLVEGVPEANDTIKHQHVENKQCSSSVGTHEVISGYQTEYAAGDIKQVFVIMHNDSSSDIHVDEWSTLKDELINASAGKADQIPHGENPNLVRNDRILLEDGKLFESQKYKRENDATVNSNICESNGSEKLSSNSPPHESIEQANEGAAGVDQLNDKLHAEDGQVNFLDETLLVKNCDNKLYTSEVHDQYLLVDDNNKKTREHPKLQSCRLLVEQASELNHGFFVDDSSFCSSEESSFSVKRIQTLANETNAMDIGVDKRNNILPDDNERRISQENVNPGELQHKLDDAICSSEESGFLVKRIRTLANETNAMAIGFDKRNSILPDDNEHRISQENVNPGELQHKLDDAICSSEESGFSVKRIRTLANETNAMDIVVDKRNSILLDDNELRISQENVNPSELHKLDDAICSSDESGFSVKRIQTLANETNAMAIGVDKRNSIFPDDNELRISQENVNRGELQHKLDDAICSSEESGFSVKKIQTLANETNAMDIRVDKRNIILTNDNELRISQENVNPGELQHKLDDAICLTEDEDRTMPIKKSEDDEKQNNPMINPTVNAVPFSDEWLAAMEAAGEKILTMKSGAVQNSPPDKSLPEPGPWSPVKRKQNSIGPFDCTKFVNIPPPNSD
ncbi:hypothetical protein ACSBR1_033552 [Camellia fascicularis]